jgi:hypothetical protein
MKRSFIVLLSVILISSVIFAQDITFGDGTDYVAGFVHGDNRQPLGRFSLTASVAGSSFVSVIVDFDGTFTLPTSIYMYPSNGDGSINQSLSIGSGTRSGSSVTISIYSSYKALSTTATNYYICIDDGASTASGSVRCKVASSSSFTITSGTLTTTINNAYLSSANVSLPVELTSFIASTNGSAITLNWQTATEVNNYGFEIERRTIANHQIARSSIDNWLKVGFAAGNGTSNTPRSYCYTDNTTATGRYVYRLKQVDNDGAFKYSQSVEVSTQAPKQFSLSQNYPNPFNPATQIRYELKQHSKIKIEILNLLGQKVQTLLETEQDKGMYTVPFDAAGLAGGTYFYKITAYDGNKLLFTETRKMLFTK